MLQIRLWKKIQQKLKYLSSCLYIFNHISKNNVHSRISLIMW